jgi:hypothetical protein
MKGCDENMKKNRKKIFGIGAAVLFILIACMPVISALSISKPAPQPIITSAKKVVITWVIDPVTGHLLKITQIDNDGDGIYETVVVQDTVTGEMAIYHDDDNDGYYERVTVLYPNGLYNDDQPPYRVTYIDSDHDGYVDIMEGDFNGDGVDERIEDTDQNGDWDNWRQRDPNGQWGPPNGMPPMLPGETYEEYLLRLLTRVPMTRPPSPGPKRPPYFF